MLSPALARHFDPFLVFFIDADVFVYAFSYAVFFPFRPLNCRSCEMFPAFAGAFSKPKHQAFTVFPDQDTPAAHSLAHLCLASFLRRMTGEIIFARIPDV